MAYETMNEVVLQFKIESGIDLNEEQKFDKNISFKERVMRNMIKHKQDIIRGLMENIKLLSQGKGTD